MTREHTTNPTITVQMETVGIHQDTIARAIRSFIAQDYAKSKLLILNHHPSPLRILGIPESMFWRIEVMNVEDVFLRPVHQGINNLKQIRTDCWAGLDDDDWLEPNHLSQLVDLWNSCTDRTQSPLRVCSLNRITHYADRVEEQSFPGWTTGLFERLTPSEVDLVYSRFPPDLYNGRDTWIASNTYYDKRDFDVPATYHWDRTGTNHMSHHETNRGETPKKAFDLALNYWRMKLEARASELKPVDLTSP